MKDKNLEKLSDLVRKGHPIDLSDAINVIKYQTELKKGREDRTNRRLRILKSISAILVTVVGTLCVVFGEVDDSPGLGGIGLILIGGAMYLNTKLVNKII